MMRFTRTPQTMELLRLIPLFSGLSDKHLRAIAKAAQEVVVVQGKVLTRQGEIGDELILIADGTASVKATARNWPAVARATSSAKWGSSTAGRAARQ
jgi:hypothetical protein